MSLDSSQLDAFLEVARVRNFSRAAKNLRITQSALSQRVLKLEEELNTMLFVRERAGVRLTDSGSSLLSYCQTKESVEGEYLARIRGDANHLVGDVRIGAYASIGRSIVMPAFQKLFLDHPALRLELSLRELRDLPGLFKNGEVDFMFLDREFFRSGVRRQLLGHEEYVLVESRKPVPSRSHVYLNHDEEDEITFRFYELQNQKPPRIERCFLDEIYSVLDSVAQGIGRSVLPRHLVENDKRIRIVPGFRPLRVPVVFHYREQVVYSALQKEVIQLVTQRVPGFFQPE